MTDQQPESDQAKPLPPPPEFDQLDRIRKLLAKSEASGVTAKESELLRDKAFELAARYEIDLALARGRPGATKEVVINRIFDVARPFAQQTALAYVVYSTFGCKLIDISTSRSRARKYGGEAHLGRVHAFGFKSDMSRADMLLTSLILQANREAARGYRKYVENFEPWSCPECGETSWRPIPRDEDWYYCVECHHQFWARRPPQATPDRRSVWYRSFWIGWVNELAPRIRAAHQKVKDEAVKSVGTGTEVALRNRDLAVQTEFEGKYPKTRLLPGGRSKGSGYSAGQEAGKRADIGQDRIGARRKEIR